MAEDDVDFAVAAYRDDGQWQLAELRPAVGEDLDALLGALGRFPSDVGVLGLVSVNDDFFVVVRRRGGHVDAVLSDLTATTDSPLARGVVDRLDLPEPTDDDPRPAGDLELLADLGIDAIELGVLCDDEELYPDEILGEVAERLGFGELFEAIVG